MKTFTIQIGSFRADYHAYETRAPQSYDGFGTISLHADPQGPEDSRWVLVRVEHERWQVARYASGAYTPVPFDSDAPHQQDYCPLLEDTLTERWVTDELYKRLMGFSEPLKTHWCSER